MLQEAAESAVLLDALVAVLLTGTHHHQQAAPPPAGEGAASPSGSALGAAPALPMAVAAAAAASPSGGTQQLDQLYQAQVQAAWVVAQLACNRYLRCVPPPPRAGPRVLGKSDRGPQGPREE